MTQEQPILPFDWFANQFTSKRREEFIEKIYPYVKAYLETGDNVIDLGCGAGTITIFLEEQAAQATGIDLAPGLITLARQEAVKRKSKAQFIQASVLTYPLGEDIFDLAVCFGNVICDFPHSSFPGFRDRVCAALKPGGHFILEYRDGLQRVAHLSEPKEVVEEGQDSQIQRNFIEYDPAMGAFKMVFRRLKTNEVYEATEYVYIGPLIRLLMEAKFEFIQSVRLDQSFLDVYIKRENSKPSR